MTYIYLGMAKVILDANVLYPAPVRDYLLRLASEGLYQPGWTTQIHEEWIRNLLINRPDQKKSDLEKTRKAMDSAFPDAEVNGYEELISSISLPDTDDKHVLAAAITAGAPLIVTNNLKDFPEEILVQYGIRAISADEFVLHLIDTNKHAAFDALDKQVKALRNPPRSTEDVLLILEKCGLIESAIRLKE